MGAVCDCVQDTSIEESKEIEDQIPEKEGEEENIETVEEEEVEATDTEVKAEGEDIGEVEDGNIAVIKDGDVAQVQGGDVPEVQDGETNLEVIERGEPNENDDGGGEQPVMTEAEVADMFNNPDIKRIDSKKVEAVWIKLRGESAKGPQEAQIRSALERSDANGDGVLTEDEMYRITKGFIQHKGDPKMTSEKLFKILDEDNSGTLTLDEVMTSFKVMWLMKKDGVKLEEMLQD